MTNEEIVAAAKKIDTPYGQVSLIHVRDDGQEVPTVMAQQFVSAIIASTAEQLRIMQGRLEVAEAGFRRANERALLLEQRVGELAQEAMASAKGESNGL